jgi:hypothetical protein
MPHEKIQAAFDARDCRTIMPESPNELAKVLEDHNIDHTSWGQGATKTLEQLFTEVQDHESRLIEPRDTSVLGRMVRVAGVDITAHIDGKRLRLYEKEQVFHHDGSTRKRKLATSISEKIAGDELPEEAAIRGIHEELGVTYGGLLTHIAERLVIRESSDSYPGLFSVYRTHTFAAQFSSQEYREEYTEVQPDKTTYFAWHPLEDLHNK